jgi:hypothetical protein
MGSCEYGDEPSGSGATDLVSWFVPRFVFWSVGWLVGWLDGLFVS